MKNTARVAVRRITKREARTRWATGTQLVGFSNSTIDTVDSYGSLHTGDPLNAFDEVVATCTGSRRGERTVYFYAPDVEPVAEVVAPEVVEPRARGEVVAEVVAEPRGRGVTASEVVAGQPRGRGEVVAGHTRAGVHGSDRADAPGQAGAPAGAGERVRGTDQGHPASSGAAVDPTAASRMPGENGRARGPRQVVIYAGKTYTCRTWSTVVPDLESLPVLHALVWLNQNTTPKGTSGRPAAPNLSGYLAGGGRLA